MIAAAEQTLLDFLCLMKARRVRVKSLKTPELNRWADKLRDAALIQWHGLEPTPWAFKAWQERAKPSVSLKSDSPTGAALADALCRWADANDISQRGLSIYLFKSKGALTRLRKVQPLQKTVARIRAFLAAPPIEKLPRRQRSGRKPPAPVPAPPEPQVTERMRHERRIQATKRRTRKRAQAALDAGISSAKASPNAAVRGAMRELTEHAEAKARAECPIERAKLIIRRHGWRCYAASVLDGERRGKGYFYINTNRVTEAELLAQADRLRK